MSGRPVGSKSNWPDLQIQETRKRIKSELDAIEAKDGTDARPAHILKQLNSLDLTSSEQRRLDGFVYMMSALVHHSRHRGLNSAQINRLHQDALQLLKLQKLDAETPRHGVLYGDLHAVLSLIYRTEGSQWAAAWQQQLAARLSKNHPDRPRAYRSLGIGLRAARLGHVAFAMSHLAVAESEHDNIREKMKARLARIKCLRLAGRRDEARNNIAEALKQPDIIDDERQELQWENAVLRAIEDNEFSELWRMTQKSKSHFRREYVIEARLWIHAQSSSKLQGKLTKLATLRSDKSLQPYRAGELYRALTAIETCYDNEFALEHRLNELGEAFERHPILVSLDLELLFFAASARWLCRIGMYELAALILAEYSAKSRSMSGGQCDDALGLLADLQGKPWFADGISDGTEP